MLIKHGPGRIRTAATAGKHERPSLIPVDMVPWHRLRIETKSSQNLGHGRCSANPPICLQILAKSRAQEQILSDCFRTRSICLKAGQNLVLNIFPQSLMTSLEGAARKARALD